ncbi:MAG: DUF962 domain-containing protein [Alphaproteobacteria bacterium]
MNPFFVEQMAMYASYHRDARNKATHFVGVPAIAVALLLPMALVPFFATGFYVVSLATLFAGAVMIYWIVLDRPIGIASAILFLPALWFAHWLAGQGAAPVWIAFGILFVGGWIIQLVGHAFEGRKPALVDNIIQIFIAPVFLMAELFFALGLCRDLHRAVEARWPHYAAKAPKQAAA